MTTIICSDIPPSFFATLHELLLHAFEKIMLTNSFEREIEYLNVYLTFTRIFQGTTN